MRILVILIGVLALGALFLTTAPGRRLGERLGIPPLRGRAPKDDRSFLLKACQGDRSQLVARLATERDRWPDATEAELYRKAIRRWFQQREDTG